MGVPPANRLLFVSDDDAFRETVTETVRDRPDILLTAVATLADARCHLATTPADCLLVDAHTDGESLPAFREHVRADYPTLPVVVAAESPLAVPASLAVHATIQRDQLAPLPEVVRLVSTDTTKTDSPAVSAE
jgi:DNA-binding NtrC family response regulator